MDRTSGYVVVRLRDDTYRLDPSVPPSPGPVAIIAPVADRTGRLLGWRLRPRVVLQGSSHKLWPTPAEALASTKLMTPGQTKSAIKLADTGAS